MTSVSCYSTPDYKSQTTLLGYSIIKILMKEFILSEIIQIIME